MLHRLACFASILLLTVVAAQPQTVVTLTADQLQNGQAVELDKLGWKYSPNDDPQFDDCAWATLSDSACICASRRKATHSLALHHLDTRIKCFALNGKRP